jgi:hypothetical protein
MILVKQILLIPLLAIFNGSVLGLQMKQDVYHVSAESGSPATLSCMIDGEFPDSCSFKR